MVISACGEGSCMITWPYSPSEQGYLWDPAILQIKCDGHSTASTQS